MKAIFHRAQRYAQRPAHLQAQRGVGMLALMFYLVVGAVVTLLCLKLIPFYIDYLSIKRVVAAMATGEDLKTASVLELRKSFDRRANIDNIQMLKGEDLDISKDNGETVISATWEQRVPLVKGFTLLVEFSVSTANK